MKENCCKNCDNAKGYTGFSDHYCRAFNCGIRAEQYDCSQFIYEDKEEVCNEQDKNRVIQ